MPSINESEIDQFKNIFNHICIWSELGIHQDAELAVMRQAQRTYDRLIGPHPGYTQEQKKDANEKKAKLNWFIELVHRARPSYKRWHSCTFVCKELAKQVRLSTTTTTTQTHLKYSRITETEEEHSQPPEADRESPVDCIATSAGSVFSAAS